MHGKEQDRQRYTKGQIFMIEIEVRELKVTGGLERHVLQVSATQPN